MEPILPYRRAHRTRGVVNGKYVVDPGVAIYTHVSGRHGSFHTSVISATTFLISAKLRSNEAPYILDGLHHQAHQTVLSIVEHCTDPAGATDRVFGLSHLLGFGFAPRIKGQKDRKLYTIDKADTLRLAIAYIWPASEV